MDTIDKAITANFLLAMPALKGQIFDRSVILMFESISQESCYGLILNKPLDNQVVNLASNINLSHPAVADHIKHHPPLLGGPLQKPFLWVLHSGEFLHQRSILIAEHLVLSWLVDFLAVLASQTCTIYEIGVGYSAWRQGQLEREIEANCWWRESCSISKVLTNNHGQRWSGLIREFGFNPDNLYDFDTTRLQ